MKTREYDEQCKLIQWTNAQRGCHKLPDIDSIFAIPNGSKLAGGVSSGVKRKKEGVKKGAPDLFLPVPCGTYHGLFIEMKAPEIRYNITNKIRSRKGTASTEQKEWLVKLAARGYMCAICYGAKEAIQTIEEYYQSDMEMPWVRNENG